MKSLISSLLLFFLLLISATLVFAQNEQKRRLVLVQSEKPFPDKISEYESAQKAANEFALKYGYGSSFDVYVSDNGTYYFTVEIENLAGIDKLNELWSEVSKKADKAELQKVFDAFKGTVDYNTSDVYSTGKYSYVPKQPRTKPEDMNFNRWTFYNLKAYYDQEGLDAVLKEIRDTCETNNSDLAYGIYYKSLGGENNQLVTVEGAASQADYYQATAEFNTKLGEKIRPLWERFLTYVRDFHGIDCWYRPDLSLINAKSQEPKK